MWKIIAINKLVKKGVHLLKTISIFLFVNKNAAWRINISIGKLLFAKEMQIDLGLAKSNN